MAYRFNYFRKIKFRNTATENLPVAVETHVSAAEAQNVPHARFIDTEIFWENMAVHTANALWFVLLGLEEADRHEVTAAFLNFGNIFMRSEHVKNAADQERKHAQNTREIFFMFAAIYLVVMFVLELSMLVAFSGILNNVGNVLFATGAAIVSGINSVANSFVNALRWLFGFKANTSEATTKIDPNTASSNVVTAEIDTQINENIETAEYVPSAPLLSQQAIHNASAPPFSALPFEIKQDSTHKKSDVVVKDYKFSFE